MYTRFWRWALSMEKGMPFPLNIKLIRSMMKPDSETPHSFRELLLLSLCELFHTEYPEIHLWTLRYCTFASQKSCPNTAPPSYHEVAMSYIWSSRPAEFKLRKELLFCFLSVSLILSLLILICCLPLSHSKVTCLPTSSLLDMWQVFILEIQTTCVLFCPSFPSSGYKGHQI